MKRWLMIIAVMALVAGCGGQALSPTVPAVQPATIIAAASPPAAPTIPATVAPPSQTVAPSPPLSTNTPVIAASPTPVPASPAPIVASPTTAPAKPVIAAPTRASANQQPRLQEYAVPSGSRPHDVAPAPDGTIWYTAQGSGELGQLDPATGATRHIPLGPGSAPHGVIVGPDGAPWITDGGLNAIVRVDPGSREVRRFPLPANRARANLNTAAFDGRGVLWFTGQNGIYGRLEPASGRMEVFDAPRGAGPYGIDATPDGSIYYASLAGNHIARINTETGAASVLEPPSARQGSRRVWSDSKGNIWVSQYNAGQVARYVLATNTWQEWKLPGDRPLAYAVYVDERDQVWLSDFGGNAIVRFDPEMEQFERFPLPSTPGNVRQILGRPGEIWGAESAADKLIVIRTS